MAGLSKLEARQRRKKGLRKRVRGAGGRPRLTVFRSLKHVYAQIIDDDLGGKVLVAASTRDKDIREALDQRRAELKKAGEAEDAKASADEATAQEPEAAPEPEKKKKKKKKDKKSAKGKKGGKAKAENAPRRKRLRYRPGAPMGKVLDAVVVGEFIARRSKEAGIESVVFDRNGFRYHGRVAALADAARSGGLKF